MRGGERAILARLLVILVVLGVLGSIAASEPDGPVAIRPTWAESDVGARDVALRGAGAEVRLEVVPYVPVAAATIVLRAPPGVEGVALLADGAEGVRTEVEPDGTTVLRFPLGDLDRGVPAVARFRFRLEGIGGAFATFEVRGSSGDREIRDALGFAVGTPGTAPVTRHGAAEFRAVGIPGGDSP